MPEYKFDYSGGPDAIVDDGLHGHIITAHDAGKKIGHMFWAPEIEDIYVEHPYRRRGIATDMFNHAKKLSEQFSSVLKPLHNQFRTYAGEMWAGSVDPEHNRPDWQKITHWSENES